jgi:MoxR-like ATPase
MTTAEIAERLGQVRAAVAERVIGQDAVIDQALIVFLARGHALLEGVPGTAKTLLIRVLASALDVDFGRIQFTPDLMPADITGTSVLREGGRTSEFRRGPVFTDLLLGDEINRAPAKTQAALLEAMQERQVTNDGVTHELSPFFTVFATQNPIEYEGTYPLPEAQLDRFLVKIRVEYPSLDAELKMLENYDRGFDAERAEALLPAALLDATACTTIRAAVEQVRVEPDVREYIAAIVRSTREDNALTLGGSPRASVSLFRVARAAAVLAGRDFVTPDDVKGLAPAVLRHRILVAPELEVEGRTSDDVIDALLARVPAPQ